MRTRVAKLAFNRGLCSRLGLARADIKRLAMAAETQTNWVSRVLGSMMIRPGLGYIGASASNAFARYIPFEFSASDKAQLELTASLLRVRVSDALITRGSVSSAVANGTFTSNLTSWTDNDESGGTSAWVTGGYMGLTGNGTAAAIRDQTVTVAAGDQGDEHALRIIIQRGPVILRVGSTAGGDEYITETELATGTHSLAFTPTGDFRIRFMSRLKRQVLVDSVAVEASGVMTLPTPWIEADLRKIRYDQSGDIIFCACAGYTQRKIERRATRSWSVVQYLPTDGPFRTENVGPITIASNALSGNVTLTASAALFKSTMAPSTNNAGALLSITSDGQRVESLNVAAQNTFTSAIRVTGVDSSRVFSIIIVDLSATGSTATLQRSLESDAGPWEDVTTYTTDQTITFDDGLDNQIAWYRLGIKTGGYVAGTIDFTLDYALGSITGTVRITAYASATSVSAEVITDLGDTAATDIWAEGVWSDRRGWPSAVAFAEGRLCWAGKDQFLGSISDAFDGFDPEFEGDAGPIQRSIGPGPVDTIQWMLALGRLILGGEAAEISCRSSSLDEPLTPTNFNPKKASTQGSANVQAADVDDRGIFVDRSGSKVYELAFGNETLDYASTHLSALVPDIGLPQIVALGVQRRPDTRIHFVRSDGTAALLTYDKVEQVLCWSEVETDGTIEDVCVLGAAAGDEEDAVYYSVKRTINAATVRYLEKWALESQCRGATLCRLADSFVTYTGAATATITAAHLAGENVVVWADGDDVGTSSTGTQTYTLNGSGQATLAAAVTNYVVGLPYSASYKSSKLVELMQTAGGSLTDTQLLKGLALILADVHAQGLKYGNTLTESEMNNLPLTKDGTNVDVDAVHTDYVTEKITMPGGWSVDARLCLLAKAPRPVTVLAALAELEHHG